MSRRTAGAAVALASLLALAACSSGAEPTTSSVAVASVAPTMGAELQPSDFAAAVKRPGTTVIDVRTPAEYAQGHLPGAVNIDVESPDFPARIAQLDRGGTYAVYCHSGNRSAAALAEMTTAGFTSAYHLAGGIAAWQQAGGELVTG